MRLIDAAKLIEEGYSLERTYHKDSSTMVLERRMIEDIPVVDAVPVVRCKDCKYAEVADTEDSQDGYTCQFHRGSIWFSGSYCSWAERRRG